jgi:ATP-dependent RNA helicase MSS116, mitochondrial
MMRLFWVSSSSSTTRKSHRIVQRGRWNACDRVHVSTVEATHHHQQRQQQQQVPSLGGRRSYSMMHVVPWPSSGRYSTTTIVSSSSSASFSVATQPSVHNRMNHHNKTTHSFDSSCLSHRSSSLPQGSVPKFLSTIPDDNDLQDAMIEDEYDNDEEEEEEEYETSTTTASSSSSSSSAPPSSDEPRRFDQIENLHPLTQQAIADMGIVHMTDIQEQTWEAAMSGRDVLGRSRTGSGKTLAFLLPALERIVRNLPLHPNPTTTTKPSKTIKMLIVSPTRELAHQIYTTTLKLTSKFGKSQNMSNSPPIHCQVLYGGTPKQADVQKMQRDMPTILTSTPGRLLDHLKTSTIHGGTTTFADCLKDIEVLVLDEMDLLLDMGFREDVQRILNFLSKPSTTASSSSKPPRQTLLFSATLPAGVKDVIRQYIRRDHVVVDCIQDSDPASHTVSTVQQSHVILPPDKMVAGIIQTILQLMKSDLKHKIIVFFPMTSQVTYFAQVFNVGLGRRVLEIHSGISQGTRTNRSDNFRHSKTAAVLFTSDVSARGVDYPDVTHVLQVGAASNRETYIHRLGRTGRAGKGGQGIILLLPNEVDFLRRDLHDISIPINSQLQNVLKMEVESGSGLENHMQRIHEMTKSSRSVQQAAIAVYQGLFGYYAQRFKNNPSVTDFSTALVNLVNGFAQQAGLLEIPPLSSKVATQHRLQNHPSLNIQRNWDTGSRSFDVSGGRRGGGGGGGRRGGAGTFTSTDRSLGYEKRFGSTNTSTNTTNSPSDWQGYVR